MKRFIILVAVVVSMTVCVPIQQAEGGSKALLIPREGKSMNLEIMITREVGVMVSMLKSAGFEVEVATVSGQPMEEGTATLKPDLKLADVKTADYEGIIMPCMAAGAFPGPPVPSEAVKIVKQTLAEGKPVAAQNGSTIILAEAGLLKGRRYAYFIDPLDPDTHMAELEKDTRFAGAIYSGNGVVKDWDIITSGSSPYLTIVVETPDTTADLTRTFIDELNRR